MYNSKILKLHVDKVVVARPQNQLFLIWLLISCSFTFALLRKCKLKNLPCQTTSTIRCYLKPFPAHFNGNSRDTHFFYMHTVKSKVSYPQLTRRWHAKETFPTWRFASDGVFVFRTRNCQIQISSSRVYGHRLVFHVEASFIIQLNFQVSAYFHSHKNWLFAVDVIFNELFSA